MKTLTINDTTYEIADETARKGINNIPSAVDKALADAKASGEFKGDPGTSVTVKSVTESTADGGSNVVTFSDGKILTVKNGKDGKDGTDGKDAVNPLSGKIAVFDGDSICAAGTDKPDLLGAYAGRIGTNNNMTVYNYAVGGGTITAEQYASNGTARHWVSRNIDTIYSEHPELDYLILEGGTNDADLIGDITDGSTPVKFGTYSEDDYSGNYDDTTYCGAIEKLFFKVLSYYPGANIGVVIPMQMGYNTNASKNRRAYFDVLIKLCRKWAIPYIDLWRTSQMNANLPVYYNSALSVEENTVQKYYQDGQHPTSKGYALLTAKIETWMQTMTAVPEYEEEPEAPDTPTYTNLVPTSVDNDGSTIFNGVGYQNGKYLSSSGWVTLSDGADSVATGFIPYALNADGSAPDIYVKGATVSTASHVRMATFLHDNGAFSTMVAAYGSSGNYAWGKYFQFEQLGDLYYKITCLNANNVKTHVRFSFLGTGENLIVTVGEPIE